MPEDAAHQAKGKKRELMENELMFEVLNPARSLCLFVW